MINKQSKNADVHLHKKKQYVNGKMGKHDMFSKKGYNILYIINDFLLGLLFLIGSLFFYFDSLQQWGIILFILGSLQMLIRPTIRLAHHFHMRIIYKKEYDDHHRK